MSQRDHKLPPHLVGDTAPGATGRFPDGKLNRNDEGELAFRIGNQGGQVVLEFGKSVRWLGMGPEDAEKLAALLNKHAGEAKAGRKAK